MKTIEKFESWERTVILNYFEDDKTYHTILLTLDGKMKGKVYKSLYWAKQKFNDYKNYPLNAIKE